MVDVSLDFCGENSFLSKLIRVVVKGFTYKIHKQNIKQADQSQKWIPNKKRLKVAQGANVYNLQGMIPTCQSPNFFKPSSKNSKKIVETMVKKLAAACLFWPRYEAWKIFKKN